MSKRKLTTGDEVLELSESVILKIKTKCPSKWKLTDMETGEEYIGTSPDDHYMDWKKIKG